MFIFTMLLSLLTSNIYKHNVVNTLSTEVDIHKNDYLGYDERYVNYYTNVTSSKFIKREAADIERIERYIEISEKINKLKNANMAGPEIHDKTIRSILKDEIGYTDISAYNIKAGGLLSDW
jgi:hypothetical protein